MQSLAISRHGSSPLLLFGYVTFPVPLQTAYMHHHCNLTAPLQGLWGLSTHVGAARQRQVPRPSSPVIAELSPFCTGALPVASQRPGKQASPLRTVFYSEHVNDS